MPEHIWEPHRIYQNRVCAVDKPTTLHTFRSLYNTIFYTENDTHADEESIASQ